MIKKEIYINNMNKFLKELNATNEQITIIINVYTSYLNSFYNNVDIVNNCYTTKNKGIRYIKIRWATGFNRFKNGNCK